jgi:hypothetical protein
MGALAREKENHNTVVLGGNRLSSALVKPS